MSITMHAYVDSVCKYVGCSVGCYKESRPRLIRSQELDELISDRHRRATNADAAHLFGFRHLALNTLASRNINNPSIVLDPL